jgi:hypothetical protein
MGVLARAALVALAACSAPKDAFDCTSNASCRNGGVTGTCESTGFCSFPDPACPMGSRYGSAAGGLSNQCVGAGSDGGVIGDGNDNALPHALGAWDVTAQLAQSDRRYSFASAVDGNFIYVIGGIAGSTDHADVWFATANPSAIIPTAAISTWTQTTPLPAVRRTFGAAYDAGYLYVFGGRSGATDDTADVLSASVNPDGTIGSWTATTSLPQSIKCQAVASAGQDVYVIGGKHSGMAGALVLHATMSGGTVSAWQLAATLDVTVFDGTALAANGYLYVIGGCTGGSGSTGNGCTQVLDVVEVAKINSDGTLGKFAHTTMLPTPRWPHTAAAGTKKGDLYVLAGKAGAKYADADSLDVVAAHQHADGNVGTWQTMTALPTGNGRTRANAFVIGSYLILLQSDSQVAQIQ